MKNRRAFALSIAGLALIFSLMFLAFFINSSVMGVWILKYAPETFTDSTSLTYEMQWNGETCFYDSGSDEWYLPVSSEEKWQGKLSLVSDKNIKIRLGPEWKEEKQSLLAAGKALPVYLEYEGNYFKTVLNLCGNPVISLETEIVEQQEDPLDNIYTGVMRVWDNENDPDAVEPFLQSNATWHLKGNAAKVSVKPPYKITLLDDNGNKTEQSFLGLEEDDDWVLNSLYSDATLSREMVLYSIWNTLAQVFSYDRASVQYRYAELIVDHEYRGVFALCSPASASDYNLTGEDVLYKWSAPVLPWNNYAFGVLDGKEQMEWPDTVTIRWPKQWYSGIWTPLGRYSNFFLLNDGELTLTKASEIINLDNLAHLIIFKQCFSLTDSTFHNMYYLYDHTDGKIYRFPWDMDASLDSTDHDPSGDELKYGVIFDYEWETLKKADPEFTAQLLQQHWNDLKQYVAPEIVEGQFRENEEYLQKSGAWDRNWAKWQIPADSHDLEETIQYYNDHFAYVSSLFGGG